MSFTQIPPSELQTITDKAVAEGRHAPHGAPVTRLCEGCYQGLSVIYHVTFDRKYICEGCADRMGCGPKALAEREIERQRKIARFHA
jgi:hypothetical protein